MGETPKATLLHTTLLLLSEGGRKKTKIQQAIWKELALATGPRRERKKSIVGGKKFTVPIAWIAIAKPQQGRKEELFNQVRLAFAIATVQYTVTRIAWEDSSNISFLRTVGFLSLQRFFRRLACERIIVLLRPPPPSCLLYSTYCTRTYRVAIARMVCTYNMLVIIHRQSSSISCLFMTPTLPQPPPFFFCHNLLLFAHRLRKQQWNFIAFVHRQPPPPPPTSWPYTHCVRTVQYVRVYTNSVWLYCLSFPLSNKPCNNCLSSHMHPLSESEFGRVQPANDVTLIKLYCLPPPPRSLHSKKEAARNFSAIWISLCKRQPL